MWQVFLISSVTSILLCRPIFHILRKFKLYDSPNHRSVHTHAVLNLGGIIIACGYIAGIIGAWLLLPEFSAWFAESNIPAASLTGAIFILLLGIADDIHGLNPFLKLFSEIIIALFLTQSGILMEGFHLFGNYINLGYFAIPFTIFWLVGIINAVNLIDGLDGLAGGVCLIIFVTHFAMSIPEAATFESTINIALIGGLLVFLKYNFNPAKIFMGDTGSLFLGYHVAIFSLTFAKFKTATLGILAPILLLGLPVLDTLLAIIRRSKKHGHIFTADKNHIHHQLMSLGFSHKSAVLMLWAFSLILSLLAYLGNIIGDEGSTTLLFCYLTVISIFLYGLRTCRSIYQNGVKDGSHKTVLENLQNIYSQNGASQHTIERLRQLSHQEILLLQKQVSKLISQDNLTVLLEKFPHPLENKEEV
jgi:UDP-GlcNAc:undecaprenyl-phosphate GlcNAc-1-phosphate transferase